MIKYDDTNNKWIFYSKVVTLTNSEIGRTDKKYTDDVAYYEEMEKKHYFITIDKVEDLVPTTEQQERLDKLNSITTDPRFSGSYMKFVEKGETDYDYREELRTIGSFTSDKERINELENALANLMGV